MSKMFSFWFLIAVIVVLAVLFFRVMASFILPLFLAVVLVVIFNPMHKWVLRKLKGRKRISAALTTATVMSIVLVPIGLLVVFATLEGRQLVQHTDTAILLAKLNQTRDRLGLDLPHANEIRELESQIESLISPSLNLSRLEPSTVEHLSVSLEQLIRETQSPNSNINLESKLSEGNKVHWTAFISSLVESQQAVRELQTSPSNSVSELNHKLAATSSEFRNFRTQLMGGSLRATLTELANPTHEELSGYAEMALDWGRSKIVSLGGATLEFFVKLIIGVVIMVLAVYFFLLDGPGMLESVKRLSPLNDRYEDELFQEFDRISRAVVVAALLSAVVQGILAGFGYWLAGLESVFLLTLLTMLFALIPFVGTSLVWLPCCAYLYLFEGRMWPAILLGIFGIAVVSQVDNLIKPLVLHGQSKIHPLFALLSILGGVATLGPIGILIGPMVVAFLQTLLKILQRELTQLDSESNVGEPAES